MPEQILLPLAALPFPEIDPILIQVGPLAVHWYGVAYIVGILFGWWYAKRLIANERLWPGGCPMKPVDIDDFLVWAALGIVLGGRVGYILFYDFQRYLANPMDILAVWQGGMSFHGGFLGCTVAMIFFARSRGYSPWHLFDVIAAGTPIAIGLVRLTNFMNSELWGKETGVAWAVIPPGDMFGRHPTQIYEALLEGLVLFLVLRVLTHVFRKLGHTGFIAGAFVTGYAAARIFVEFYRVPDPQLGYLFGGWLTMGMLLSVPMALAGIWAMATAKPTVLPKAA